MDSCFTDASLVWTVGFLLAEKTFADAERRVAAQSRQAALSELFFAQVAGGVRKFGFVGSKNGQGVLRLLSYGQAQADSAILGANTALSASSLGLASVAAEFSKTLSSGALWPAVTSSVSE